MDVAPEAGLGGGHGALTGGLLVLLYPGAPWGSVAEPERGARQLGKLASFLCLCVLGRALWPLREFRLCGCDLGTWLASKSFQIVSDGLS